MLLARIALGQHPVNDLCTGAITLTNGVLYSIDTRTATPQTDGNPTCVGSFGKGVWFAFTTPAAGNVSISTCGSSFDTCLQLYTGNCNVRIPVAGGCNDDDGPECPGSRQSSLRLAASGGTNYLVLVGDFNAIGGDLRIVATWTVPPVIRIVPLTMAFSNFVGTATQSFRIFNDGGSALTVYSITPETPAPWVTLGTPGFPFSVSGGGHQDISVTVDFAQAPQGNSIRRLLVTSNDPTQSPYPGGVNVVVANERPFYLSGVNWSNAVCQFVVNGPIGSNCVVQGSSNLFTWQPVVTNVIPGAGSFPVSDPVANQATRFYRALLR